MSIARRITQWSNDEVGVVLKASYRLLSGKACDIRVAKTTHDIGRLLLIVSRKTGNAPDRNRFKRRVKSIFYQEKLYTKGFDWIIFAKKAGMNAEYPELKTIFMTAAARL
jgi:ribonuclease P protein component